MTIKIEIPSNNQNLVQAIGKALANYEYLPTSAEAGFTVPARIPKDEGLELDTSGEAQIEDPVKTDQEDNTGGDVPNVDEKGVQFIPAVCGEAQVPFYASGPRKGQWKKKRNITDENYDAVYVNALNQVTAAAASATTAPELSDAEKAFGDKKPAPEATNITPDLVFALYSKLVQAGRPEPANAVFNNHGLANGTLIYSRPELAPEIHAELLVLDQAV